MNSLFSTLLGTGSSSCTGALLLAATAAIATLAPDTTTTTAATTSATTTTTTTTTTSSPCPRTDDQSTRKHRVQRLIVSLHWHLFHPLLAKGEGNRAHWSAATGFLEPSEKAVVVPSASPEPVAAFVKGNPGENDKVDILFLDWRVGSQSLGLVRRWLWNAPLVCRKAIEHLLVSDINVVHVLCAVAVDSRHQDGLVLLKAGARS